MNHIIYRQLVVIKFFIISITKIILLTRKSKKTTPKSTLESGYFSLHCIFLNQVLGAIFQINFVNLKRNFCHIVIYAFILLDQLFIANGIHRIPIKTGIVISRYGDQISFPKTQKVLVLKISVELPTNGIKSNAFCIL